MIEHLSNIQGLMRGILKPVIHNGDTVLDLTAGKGRDTLFLAECVGPQGRVHAFDIQEEALAETLILLQKHGLQHRVRLHAQSHARVHEYVHEPVRVAIFNLGYLPGYGRNIITEPASTLQALDAVLALLCVGGFIGLTVYRGHQGGNEEAKAVDCHCQALSRRNYSVLRGEYLNSPADSPYWIFIQKTREA